MLVIADKSKSIELFSEINKAPNVISVKYLQNIRIDVLEFAYTAHECLDEIGFLHLRSTDIQIHCIGLKNIHLIISLFRTVCEFIKDAMRIWSRMYRHLIFVSIWMEQSTTRKLGMLL